MESGELSPRSWRDYYRACAKLVELLGKNRLVAELAPEDFSKLRFKLAQTRGPVALYPKQLRPAVETRDWVKRRFGWKYPPVVTEALLA